MWVPKNLSHLVCLDKRFLKRLFGLSARHLMENWDQDCRRMFVGNLLLRSGYRCNDQADILRFDDEFLPKWEDLYAMVNISGVSATFWRAPGGDLAQSTVTFKRRGEEATWTESAAEWSRSQ